MTTKRSDNLCNFYILPLLGLNSANFGGAGNFIKSYVSLDLNHIIVETKETFGNFETHENYVAEIVSPSNTQLTIFSVPPHFKPTVIKFKEGKFSQFSREAKILIKRLSGLNYRVHGKDGKYHSSRVLLALDKDPDLKAILEKELGVKLSNDSELYDIPSEKNFYDLQINQVCQKSE